MVLRLISIFGIVLLISCGSDSSEIENAVKPIEGYSGEQLYKQNCITCHGKNGDLGVSGATDLSQSVKSLEEKVDFIKKGSGDGVMQAYGIPNGGALSTEEITKIAEYVGSFKKQ